MPMPKQIKHPNYRNDEDWQIYRDFLNGVVHFSIASSCIMRNVFNERKPLPPSKSLERPFKRNTEGPNRLLVRKRSLSNTITSAVSRSSVSTGHICQHKVVKTGSKEKLIKQYDPPCKLYERHSRYKTKPPTLKCQRVIKSPHDDYVNNTRKLRLENRYAQIKNLKDNHRQEISNDFFHNKYKSMNSKSMKKKLSKNNPFFNAPPSDFIYKKYMSMKDFPQCMNKKQCGQNMLNDNKNMYSEVSKLQIHDALESILQELEVLQRSNADNLVRPRKSISLDDITDKHRSQLCYSVFIDNCQQKELMDTKQICYKPDHIKSPRNSTDLDVSCTEDWKKSFQKVEDAIGVLENKLLRVSIDENRRQSIDLQDDPVKNISLKCSPANIENYDDKLIEDKYHKFNQHLGQKLQMYQISQDSGDTVKSQNNKNEETSVNSHSFINVNNDTNESQQNEKRGQEEASTKGNDEANKVLDIKDQVKNLNKDEWRQVLRRLLSSDKSYTEQISSSIKCPSTVHMKALEYQPTYFSKNYRPPRYCASSDSDDLFEELKSSPSAFLRKIGSSLNKLEETLASMRKTLSTTISKDAGDLKNIISRSTSPVASLLQQTQRPPTKDSFTDPISNNFLSNKCCSTKPISFKYAQKNYSTTVEDYGEKTSDSEDSTSVSQFEDNDPKFIEDTIRDHKNFLERKFALKELKSRIHKMKMGCSTVFSDEVECCKFCPVHTDPRLTLPNLSQKNIYKSLVRR